MTAETLKRIFITGTLYVLIITTLSAGTAFGITFTAELVRRLLGFMHLKRELLTQLALSETAFLIVTLSLSIGRNLIRKIDKVIFR